MKYLSLWIIVMVILICFFGCSKDNAKVYKENIENIADVKLVEIGEFNEELNKYSEKVLCDISDIESFIDELSTIECTNHYGDPETLYANDIVIKIVYSNGDFDLISHDAQDKYRSGLYNYGYLTFDKEQFETLIDKYLSN